MNKIYLLSTYLLFTVSLLAQMGQIQNGGFENWTNQSLFDYPTQWGNSNSDEWRGVPTVVQSVDAQEGTYSVELNAVEAGPGPDTLIAYVYHGNVGPTGPDAGVLYPTAFDEVRFQYKCDLAMNDTLYLLYFRFVSGAPVDMGMIPVADGTMGAWTQGTVSVPAVSQEELFIGFVLGDPFTGISPTPGSWARVDNVEIYNLGLPTVDLPDPGFEQWSTQTIETPDSWYTLNEMLLSSGIENAIKSIDANSGTYAIEMTTVQEPMSGDTITSILSMGPIDVQSMSPFTPVPYNATPTTLSGAYKYSPQGGDQAEIQIIFLEAGSMIGTHFETMNAAASYTTFSSPLLIAGTPDSVIFTVFSGENPGSVLKLDDLAFSGGDVGITEFEKMSVSLYPNPARDIVMVKADGVYNVTIMDLAGNIILHKVNLTKASKLNISELSAGAYIVKIDDNNKTRSLKFIKQ